MVRKEAGKDFPQDPQVQLNMAIEAVFRSWYNPRAAHLSPHEQDFR